MTPGSFQYAHEGLGWSAFAGDNAAFSTALAIVPFRRGALVTALGDLNLAAHQQAAPDAPVQDVTQSSTIGILLEPALSV